MSFNLERIVSLILHSASNVWVPLIMKAEWHQPLWETEKQIILYREHLIGRENFLRTEIIWWLQFFTPPVLRIWICFVSRLVFLGKQHLLESLSGWFPLIAKHSDSGLLKLVVFSPTLWFSSLFVNGQGNTRRFSWLNHLCIIDLHSKVKNTRAVQ